EPRAVDRLRHSLRRGGRDCRDRPRTGADQPLVSAQLGDAVASDFGATVCCCHLGPCGRARVCGWPCRTGGRPVLPIGHGARHGRDRCRRPLRRRLPAIRRRGRGAGLDAWPAGRHPGRPAPAAEGRMSVTILMPVYNGAAFLARSLKSISEQTYGDWRVVIGDDGSTDDSLAVIERSGLPRLTLRRNARNIGWAQTVNLLLAEVDTAYVAVLHQDDWWEPEFLGTVTAMLDRTPASLLAVTAARAVHPSRPDAVWGLHQGFSVEKGDR